MFNDYSLEVSRIFKWAEKEMLDLKQPYVGTEHLLLSLLKNNTYISNLLKKYDVTYDSFRNELINVIGSSSKRSAFILYTPLLKRIINNCEGETTPLGLLKSLIKEDEGIAIRLLIGMNVDLEKLYMELIDDSIENSISFGINLQETVNMNDNVFGRDKEINEIISVLIRKNKNNPILVGGSGVGKTAIVEELARRINKGLVPNCIKSKKIIVLSMASLVAGTKYRGEFEEKLNKIIKEIENNSDIILFIDEIHTIVNAGGAEGAVNASDILKPYMARNTIRIIGATTSNEYNKYILKDKALARRFELIRVLEPDKESTINILNKIKGNYEKHYNIKITKDNIKTIVEESDNYLKNRFNPDKSITALDYICAKKMLSEMKPTEEYDSELTKIKTLKNKMVQLGDFDSAIKLYKKEKSINNKINYKKFDTLKKEEIISLLKESCNIKDNNIDINNIKKYLKKYIVDQDAINKIINAIVNKKVNKPTSILLVGSKKIDKKEIVKLISNYLSIPLIYIDMSEYNDELSINRLIGANIGYVGYDDENIFDKIKFQPQSIILLDEFEKSSPSVLNLIFKIIDNGVITNRKNEIIDFSKTIIFMTSNISLTKKIGFISEYNNYEGYFSKNIIDHISSIVELKKDKLCKQ